MQSQSIGTRLFLTLIVGMMALFLVACTGTEEPDDAPAATTAVVDEAPATDDSDGGGDEEDEEAPTPEPTEEAAEAEPVVEDTADTDANEAETSAELEVVEAEEADGATDDGDANAEVVSNEDTDSEEAEAVADDVAVAEDVANEEEETAETIDQTTYKGIPVGFTEDGNAYMGDLDAPVRIEEYSDYQCPFCQRFVNDTMVNIKGGEITDGEAVLIFYDFPLSFHPQAGAAANAARCAGEVGAAAYWAMHDALFENLGKWSVSNPVPQFISYAEQIAGVDIPAFTECAESDRYQADVQADTQQGSSLGVRGTPAFFVNGELLSGAQPYGVFVQAIALAASGESIVEEPEPIEVEEPTPIELSDNYAFALGDEDAKVVIVEYTDLQCPYCARYSAETLPTLIANYVETGRVRYEFRDLPLDQLHPLARDASVAARCAGEQDKYVEMHDVLFAQQSIWGSAGQHKVMFQAYAAQLELEAEAFEICMSSGKFDEAIDESVREALALGLNSTPYFVVNGFPIVRGAQPLENFEYVIELVENDGLVDAIMDSQRQQAQQAQQAEQQQQQQQPAPVNVGEIPEGDSYVMGSDDAPITIVEYTDYQCPFCSRHFSQTFAQIKQNYIDEGLVRYVFKDFPLSFHAQANDAAVAAHCAGEQDAFYEMHTTLFDNQAQWGNENVLSILSDYASNLGLDVEAFDTCMQSGEYDSAIQADFNQGSGFGVRGTPAFFVNGEFVNGAQPYTIFEQVIQAQLGNQ